MGALLSLLLAGPLLAGTLQVSLAQDGAGAVRVPIRAAAGGALGRPEVHAGQGVVLVEVPEGHVGRVERKSATVSGAAGEVESVSAATSHSRHRATVTLHLRPGAELGAERVAASLADGVLTVRVLPGGAGVAVGQAGQAAGVQAEAGRAPRVPAAARGAMARAVQQAPQGDEARAAAPTEVAPAAAAVTPAAGADRQAAVAPALQEDKPTSTLALRVAGALGLLGLAAWLAARHRWTRAGDVRPTAINIVSTRMLGKRERLMVIDVNKQRFLLSASDQGGVRLVSPIDQVDGQVHGQVHGQDHGQVNGLAEEGPAAAERGAGDPLKEVFADMLADVSVKESAAARGGQRPAAEPAKAAQAEARPALHLVPDEDETEEDRQDGDEEEEETGAPRSAPALAAVRQGPAAAMARTEAQRQASGGERERSQGNDSTDVAGLMALRQHRQRVGR